MKPQDAIGHFYEPIPAYENQVLKYQGIANHENKQWMLRKPGMQLLDTYKGDRIRADTHAPFHGEPWNTNDESREHLLGAEIEARLALNCALSEKRGFAVLNALEAAVQALHHASAELNRED